MGRKKALPKVASETLHKQPNPSSFSVEPNSSSTMSPTHLESIRGIRSALEEYLSSSPKFTIEMQREIRNLFQAMVDITVSQELCISRLQTDVVIHRDLTASLLDSRPSYAEVARLAPTPSNSTHDPPMSTREPFRPALTLIPNDHVVLLTPQDKNLHLADLETTLKREIDPRAEKIGILSVRKGKFAVVIRCNSASDATRLTHSIRNNSTISNLASLSTPKLTKPKLLISGVDSSITKEDITEIIRKHNDLNLTTQDLEARFPLRGRNGTTNWVLEATPDAFKTILQLGKILVGWSVCPVREYIYIPRCFKCCLLGHLQKDCPLTDQHCTLCGEPHSYKNCKSAFRHCRSCDHSNTSWKTNYKTDHGSLDSDCPSYLRELELRKMKTDYDSTPPTQTTVHVRP